MTDRRVTLVDVAARAGVSMKTVSRVVNNEPNVASATAARVAKAVRELGFVPHRGARSLSGGKAMAIGLVAGLTPESLFANSLVAGILSRATERGYDLLLFSSLEMPGERVERAFLGRQMDGVIVVPHAVGGNQRLLHRLKALRQPYVVIHPADLRLRVHATCVRIDEREGARKATEYLLSLGHRTIGVLSVPVAAMHTASRIEGHREALSDAGIAFREDLIFESGLPFTEVGYVGARDLLLAHGDMTALFAFTDEVAMGAVRAIRQLGRDVPEDVSVMGFNDSPLAAVINPPLTTVHHPFDEMSRAAVDLLIDRIERPSQEPVDLVLPTTITVRESSGPPPAGVTAGSA